MSQSSPSGARLKRINADTTWLLTLPATEGYSTSTFNVLIDPWLDATEQVDFARSFSAQQRVTPALAASVAELEELAAQEVDADQGGGNGEADDKQQSRSRQIDAMLLSHPFTDHAHPETLLDPSVPKHIPLLVTSDAYKVLPVQIKEAAKKGERQVHELEHADPKARPSLVSRAEGKAARYTAPTHLPSNIAILQTRPRPRMPAILGGPPALASQQLHGGVFFLWSSSEASVEQESAPSQGDVHAILYTPHGSVRSSVPKWLSQSPVKPCAILTSLDRIVLPSWISGTVNLGLPGALQLMLEQQDSKASSESNKAPFAARHLIDTHGEHKTKQGLVASLMRRYYLGNEAEEISCDDKNAEEKAAVEAKEQQRQSEAQRLIDAAFAKASHANSNDETAAVHCLAVGDLLHLP